jgi:hypothetical protein
LVGASKYVSRERHNCIIYEECWQALQELQKTVWPKNWKQGHKESSIPSIPFFELYSSDHVRCRVEFAAVRRSSSDQSRNYRQKNQYEKNREKVLILALNSTAGHTNTVRLDKPKDQRTKNYNKKVEANLECSWWKITIVWVHGWKKANNCELTLT